MSDEMEKGCDLGSPEGDRSVFKVGAMVTDITADTTELEKGLEKAKQVTLENIGAIMDLCDKIAGERPWFMCEMEGRSCAFFVQHMTRQEEKTGAKEWLFDGEDPLPSMNGKDFKMNGKCFFLEELHSFLKASGGGE